MNTDTPINKRKRSGRQPSKDENPRVERKRMQNRISQQCLRERQMVLSRQRAELIETIKSTNEGGQNSGELNSVPLNTFMKVVEENEKLKDALLRLRKKLLSFSNLVENTADDGIFDFILSSNGNRLQGKEATSAPESPVRSVEPLIGEDSSPIRLETHSTASSAVISPCASADSRKSQHELDSPDLLHPDIFQDTHLQNGDLENIEIQLCHTSPVEACTSSTSNIFDFSMPQFGISPELVAHHTERAATFNYAVNPDKVREACVTYMGQVLNSQSIYNDGGEKAGLLSNLAAVAVYLLATLSGLETYIYGLGASNFMFHIMRWRLSPTPANYMAIPVPYRPTFLQCNTSNYALTIDFIAWPTIRDQLIQHTQTCDIDQIMRDIVFHTVFELPEKEVAVNILDFFQSKILDSNITNPKLHSNLSVFNPGWRFNERMPKFSLSDSLYSNSWNRENSLLREIYWRITYSAPPPLVKNTLVSQYGIDRCTQWKLSKEFSQRHTFLDCRGVATDFDMVPCATVSGF